ncbi:MAG: hypothetical protein K2X27_17565 [Candidatus Obscuribacterales bacterium]|nr:hypothetical protein [Candidatus Obscuribacterales bacterium]
MGRPLRNGGNSFQVAIRPLVKTCPKETGINRLSLPDGTKILILAHAYFPSHDRELHSAVLKLMKAERPEVTILLGGMIHEEAFKAVVDDKDVVTKLTKAHVPPEITAIMKASAVTEKRFLNLAALCGKFINEYATASGGHVYYIPSVTGMLPNEVDIMRFVLEQKERLDEWADKHPDEAKKGPDVPKEFNEFLGLKGNPNITVLPFGSALVVNNNSLFVIGDFRRRNPLTAGKTEQANNIDMDVVVRSFDGKVSSAWETLPLHTLPEATRRFKAVHEVGNLFDLSKGLGYLRDYDLRAKGVVYGQIQGGRFNGFAIPALEGADGRRAFSIFNRIYDEDELNPGMRNIELPTPASVLKKDSAKAESKPASKPVRKTAAKKAPAKKSSRRTPKSGK